MFFLPSFLTVYWARSGTYTEIGRPHAEHVLAALLGELGVGRRRRDRGEPRLGVDRDRREAGRGRVVAQDGEDRVVRGELLGDGGRVLRVALVVLDPDHDLLALDPALGVDLVRGELGALRELLADLGEVAGHGGGDADDDVLGGGRCSPAAAPIAARSSTPRRRSMVMWPSFAWFGFADGEAGRRVRRLARARRRRGRPGHRPDGGAGCRSTRARSAWAPGRDAAEVGAAERVGGRRGRGPQHGGGSAGRRLGAGGAPRGRGIRRRASRRPFRPGRARPGGRSRGRSGW